MEKLDYGTILSPCPITLSIGTLRKPTLMEIAELTFDKFTYFQFLVQLTPEIFFEKIADGVSKNVWESLSDEKRNEIDLFDIVTENEHLIGAFLDIFNFFFLERVIFDEGLFILLKPESENTEAIEDRIKGVIPREIFGQVLELIQQICCVYEEKEVEPEETSFKNKLAKKLYDKMRKAKQKAEKERKSDINYNLPNIISSVSNKHPSINPINVWDMTLFQLLDSFNRMQVNSIFDIDSTRISVWGDEKKTFDPSLWYKNEYDKKQSAS